MRSAIPFVLLATCVVVISGCGSPGEEMGGYIPTEDRPGFLYFYTDG
jgi:hypothetical protein